MSAIAKNNVFYGAVEPIPINDGSTSATETWSGQYLNQEFSAINSTLDNLLKYKDFTIPISFGAGTIGTRGSQETISYDNDINFGNIVSIEITYINDSSAIMPIVFRTESYIYINSYRCTASAVTNNIRVRIYYKKLT